MPISSNLPIDAVLPELVQQLAAHNRLLLAAEPGAGKTTKVPLALLDQSKKILMLEPRRLATRNAATRLAQQLGEAVGDSVGYKMRMENKSHSNVKIEVITEGILTRYLQQDPALEDVALVIFDEFHERSIQSDLGLALCLQAQELFNPDLKLLIMSATLDVDKIQTLLDCPVIECEGRQYPVDIEYRPLPSTKSFIPKPYEIIPHCVEIIQHAIKKHDGSVLVFLPGAREIEEAARHLQATINSDSLHIHTLYGQLSDSAQQAAIQPCKAGHRKVVLATNIAESSLTIDGISVVIDSGLHKQAQFQPRIGTNKLSTRYISAASATQRAGRAGRLQAGTCYRLWSQNQSLEQHDIPEIQRVDLADFAIAISQWGVSVEELNLLDTPNSGQLAQAYEILQLLEIIDDQHQLMSHGEQCVQLPLSPRLAHMLIKCQASQYFYEICCLAALLSEPTKALNGIALIEHQLQQLLTSNEPWAIRLKQLAKQWQKLLFNKNSSGNNIEIQALELSQLISFAVSQAFPDRVAKKISHNKFKLANGFIIELPNDSSNSSAWQPYEYLAISDLTVHSSSGNNQKTAGQPQRQNKEQLIIRSAIELTSEQLFKWFDKQLTTSNRVEWNSQGQLVNEQQTQLLNLVVRTQPNSKLSSEEKEQAWQSYFSQHGLKDFNWNSESLQLRARNQLLSQQDSDWPSMNDQYLLDHMDQWLLPFLSNIQNKSGLKKLQLHSMLLSLLDWNQQQILDEQLPTHFKVPSGSRYQLDYTQNPPVLAVKLQEMFGCEAQPTVARNSIPLQIHLLSPAGRPLQITQDLSHFWRNTYPEVRKDMRGRYPKHPWPEDPLTFTATAKTKRHLK